eukprot:scaffold259624_cov27-Prasinocladus_malaysianus.AAC.1
MGKKVILKLDDAHVSPNSIQVVFDAESAKEHNKNAVYVWKADTWEYQDSTEQIPKSILGHGQGGQT